MGTILKELVLLPIMLLQLWQLVVSEPQWHTASDGTRYLIETALQYNWLQAVDECARRDLQLLEIDNAEKNEILIALIQRVYGKSHDLWLGYHDEFSSDINTNRPFFLISTGKKLSFTYWKTNEPNNINGIEHCVLIWSVSGFRWNDGNCEDPFGFVCEERHYRKDMNSKRLTAKQKNTQLAAKFTNTQSEIEEINANAQREADTVLLELKHSKEEIIADFKKSLNEILKKKPYLKAVIADVGQSINDIALEKEQEFEKVSDEALQSMRSIHLGVESSTNGATAKFSEELAQNTNEIDQLFVV